MLNFIMKGARVKPGDKKRFKFSNRSLGLRKKSRLPRQSDPQITETSSVGFRSILVPIDFSERSKKALEYAASLAEQFRGEVVVLHVLQPVMFPGELGYTPAMILEMNEQLEKETEEKLLAISRYCINPIFLKKAVVRMGTAFNEINEVAKIHHVDLIILTTHGYTGLKHVFLGSTAERVVRHAPCPVLVVREPAYDVLEK
jgi:universal stress protein A